MVNETATHDNMELDQLLFVSGPILGLSASMDPPGSGAQVSLDGGYWKVHMCFARPSPQVSLLFSVSRQR